MAVKNGIVDSIAGMHGAGQAHGRQCQPLAQHRKWPARTSGITQASIAATLRSTRAGSPSVPERYGPAIRIIRLDGANPELGLSTGDYE
jgi:hypothetical protein